MSKFLIKENPSGLTFHLIAENGKTIGTSQVYSSREACEKGIESVRHNAVKAQIEDLTLDEKKVHPKFEIYKDKAGDHRFRLTATNGQEILASQAYTSKESCEKGIKSVIVNAPEAAIADM